MLWSKKIQSVHLLCLILMAALLAAPSASADAVNGVITSEGPLTRVQTTADLGCAVNHASDSYGEFYGDTACGTLMAVNGTLYGPATIPAGSNASPRTAWTTQSQESQGAGTAVNPYRILTRVSGGGLDVTQTDTYVKGAESYGTRVSVANTSGSAKTVTLYRAADCYLQNSDIGYGAKDDASGAVSCIAGLEPGSRIEQWAPLTPGSHYYESGYSSVWAVIGSQSPFPDTCDCDIYQDNGAGLSWTKTIPAGSTESFSHLTAFSPTGVKVEDSDGDGFPDTWEEPSGGVDTSGDGKPDLKLSDFGATPNKPDIFLQVGWTKTRSCVLLFFCSTKNRRPSLVALRDVQSAFASHGIRLHIDAGAQSLMNPDNGATWGSKTRAGDGVEAPALIPGWDDNGSYFNWETAFDGYRQSLLPPERRRLFHFALYVGRFHGGSSGRSRGNSDSGFAGPDLMLAYDVFQGGSPTRIKEAGTLMHELGHNLGLTHGGSLADENVNYKPNYPSLMNYAWQLSGTYKYSHYGLLDYSDGTLAAIDEHALSESAGLEPNLAAGDIATKWSCPNREYRGPSPSLSNVDWNCNGPIDGGTVGVNVNNPAEAPNNDPTLSVLRDHDDWSALIFDGGGALGGAGDPESAAATTAGEEASTAELEAAAGDLHTVALDGPGQLSIQSHTSAPVGLTIANRHDQARTYTLTTISEGIGISGLPGQVTLAGGESRTLNPTLAAGAANDSAFFEVDAISGNDLTDADSAIAEVFVVDRAVPDQPGQSRSAPGATAIRPGNAAPRVAILSDRARVNARGLAAIRLACGAGSGRCRGTLSLTVRGVGASASFSIAALGKARVKVKVAGSARRLLAAAKRHRLGALAVAKGGANTARRSLTLIGVAPRRPRPAH